MTNAKLKNIRIDEISLVDRPANPGARIVLKKGTTIDIGKASLEMFNILASQLRKHQPQLTQEQAFAKVYTDPENTELRLAERSANGFIKYPPVARTEPNVLDSLAYDKIVALAREFRRGHPFLTPEQAFAQVYSDPANRDLVAQERAEALAQ